MPFRTKIKPLPKRWAPKTGEASLPCISAIRRRREINRRESFFRMTRVSACSPNYITIHSRSLAGRIPQGPTQKAPDVRPRSTLWPVKRTVRIATLLQMCLSMTLRVVPRISRRRIKRGSTKRWRKKKTSKTSQLARTPIHSD